MRERGIRTKKLIADTLSLVVVVVLKLSRERETEERREAERQGGSLVTKYGSFYLYLGTRLFMLDWANHGVGSW